MKPTLAEVEEEAARVFAEASIKDLEYTREIARSVFGDDIADLFERAAIDRNAQATKEFARFIWERDLVPS